MNNEQVLRSFSFGLEMPRFNRNEPRPASSPVFISLEYLSYGVSFSKSTTVGSVFLRFFLGGDVAFLARYSDARIPPLDLSLNTGSSSTADICIDSIHCFTLSVIPQPAGYSVKSILPNVTRVLGIRVDRRHRLPTASQFARISLFRTIYVRRKVCRSRAFTMECKICRKFRDIPYRTVYFHVTRSSQYRLLDRVALRSYEAVAPTLWIRYTGTCREKQKYSFVSAYIESTLDL